MISDQLSVDFHAGERAVLGEANRSLAQSPTSPPALLAKALVEIAHFKQTLVRTRLRQAIRADARLVPAQVYPGNLWLGGDYLEKAGQRR